MIAVARVLGVSASVAVTAAGSVVILTSPTAWVALFWLLVLLLVVGLVRR